MKDIVIIGASGFAKEVAWLIEDINKEKNEWNILGFIDNDESLIGTKINGYEVIGNDNWLMEQELYVACGIGSSIIRKKIISKLEKSKNKFPVLIHPNVVYSDTVSFGEGVIVCASNVLTVNITVGKHTIINLSSTIGHDTVVGDFTTILPGVNVSGNVQLGECSSIGTGSAIIQGVFIGENTIVGAGAVVVKDLPSNCTAVGAPARAVKFNT